MGTTTREKRQTIIAVSREIEWGLCAFCRYFTGGCEDAECEHPLEIIMEQFEDAATGSDCWGFRRKKLLSIPDIADIVGMILASGIDFAECAYLVGDNGQLNVYFPHWYFNPIL